MNPALWIWLLVITSISTFVCGYNSICNIESATICESVDARKPAILWTIGAAFSLLGVLLTIFSA